MVMTQTQLNKLLDKGAKIVDIRSPLDFASTHMPTAKNIQLKQVSTILSKFKRSDTLLLCALVDDDVDLVTFRTYAQQFGFMDVRIIGSIKHYTLVS